ncbi:MAG: YceI family protein [Acidimicrobiales bacterium]|nr:YceI family protein [Acidimicrobiales bacterium]
MNTNELEDRTSARSRRPLAIVAILAVLAIAGVGAAYLAFFNDDAPERLALSDDPVPTTAAGPAGTTATTAAAAGGSDLAGTWRVASGSTAGYRVREKLAALPAKSDAVGRSPAVTGTVQVAGSGTALTASDARFEVDLTQLTSDESRRDNRIRTDGLQTNQFPKATFVSTKPIPLPAETASGQAVKATAEGDLTIHGVTKRVSIPLDVRVAGGKGELVGSLGFPMSDFNITPPNIGGFVTVDPDATLEFKLVLEKA